MLYFFLFFSVSLVGLGGGFIFYRLLGDGISELLSLDIFNLICELLISDSPLWEVNFVNSIIPVVGEGVISEKFEWINYFLY